MEQWYSRQDMTAITKFSIKKIYNRMKSENERVYSDVLVWNRLAIPKHRFTCWLVMHNKLRTANKLVQIGIMVNVPLVFAIGYSS